MLHALRLWFAEIQQCINLQYYCKLTGVNPSNLSQFIKGSNTVSYQKLDTLRKYIVDDLAKKIA